MEAAQINKVVEAPSVPVPSAPHSSSFSFASGGDKGTEFDSEGEESAEKLKEREEKRLAAEKEQEEKRMKRAAELANTVIKPGDWQIQVNIIKVKDLAARDANGTRSVRDFG